MATKAGDYSSSDITVLRGLDLELHPGRRVALRGRNGAGKSTILKVLSRITEPTEGRAVLRGRVASLLEVGTGFHPELTGRENTYLNGAILGMRRGSRLYRALVRGRQVAQSATAYTFDLAKGADILVIDATARPGTSATWKWPIRSRLSTIFRSE